MITYTFESRPDAVVIAELYRLAELDRPIGDPSRIRRMFDGSTLVMTAWDGETLVGVLRGWTDGAWNGLVCDLAVDPEYRRQGVGGELLKRVTESYPDVRFLARAESGGGEFLESAGWERVGDAWVGAEGG